jgi:hypothetical protein
MGGGSADMGGAMGFNWATCMDYNQAGVSAMDFCAYYMSKCMFGGAMRYMNMGECVTKYMDSNQKACQAGHLCVAGKMAPNTHCPHATQIGQCM